MNSFELAVLGGGSAFPTNRHNPSAQALCHHDRVFLIDCGEGTQQYYRRQGLKLGRLQHIFISHLHGDHCLGLVGLISTLGLFDRGEKSLCMRFPMRCGYSRLCSRHFVMTFLFKCVLNRFLRFLRK